MDYTQVVGAVQTNSTSPNARRTAWIHALPYCTIPTMRCLCVLYLLLLPEANTLEPFSSQGCHVPGIWESSQGPSHSSTTRVV